MLGIDGDLSHWGGFLLGAAATVSSVAAVIGARRAGRAASSAGEAAATTKETRRQVTPKNGKPFNTEVTERLDAIADQVEGLARTTEFIEGRTHDISKRVDAQGLDLGRIGTSLSALEGQSIAISERFEEHLDAVAIDRAEWVEIRDRLKAGWRKEQ